MFNLRACPFTVLFIFIDWYGDASDGNLDRRSLASMSYLSFYELIKGGGKRKKYGRSAVNSNDAVVLDGDEEAEEEL